MTQLPEDQSGSAPASWFRGRAWLLLVLPLVFSTCVLPTPP